MGRYSVSKVAELGCKAADEMLTGLLSPSSDTLRSSVGGVVKEVGEVIVALARNRAGVLSVCSLYSHIRWLTVTLVERCDPRDD